MDTKDIIPVGSGFVYEMEYSGEIPEDNIIETEDNKFGDIEAGATLTYTCDTSILKDDFGIVTRTILTAETVTFGFGVITWVYKKLNAMCSTARVTDASGIRTVKIGGIKNANGSKRLIRFVHKDDLKGDVRITLVGTNTGGLTLAYTIGAATKVEPTITAEPIDGEGTLVIIELEIPDPPVDPPVEPPVG